MTGAGSTAAPRRRSSKCRCGPVERPVEPTRPSSAPAATHWPRRTDDLRQVRVPARHARAVAEDDELAVAAGVAVRDLDAAGSRPRAPAGPRGDDEVEPGVEGDAARAEAVADRVGRPGGGSAAASAAAGGAARRASPAPATPSAGEAGPRLEAPQRGVGAGAEAAVERAGGEAVGGEQELQAGDVPAAGAQRQRPAAEPRPPAAAERAARLRARRRRRRAGRAGAGGAGRRRWWPGPATPSTLPA